MAGSQRKPPRWFGPAILLGSVAAVSGLVGLGYLLYDPALEPIKIGERSYFIPPSELASLQLGPPVFVRIRPSNEPFDLVFDGRAAAKRDANGLPLIFSVNDHGEHSVWYSRQGRSIVACKRASNPMGGCGTWISYGGQNWTVLFPQGRLSETDRFARSATGHLRRYDTRARGLLN